MLNYRKDGRKYEGFWKGGKMHGKGKKTTATGEVVHGAWENGVEIETLNSNNHN